MRLSRIGKKGLIFISSLFLAKSQGVVIARLLLSSSCKKLHCSPLLKKYTYKNTKLGILAHHD